MSSDTHLESALQEYNERVAELELSVSRGKGNENELLESYVNRSSILIMMDSYIAAMSDLDDAVELMAVMSSSGMTSDAGTFVKVHINKGVLLADEEDPELMADEYRIASTRLNELSDHSRHYDRQRVIRMCIECSNELIDSSKESDAVPFCEKAEQMLSGSVDPWSMNRMLEIYNIKGHTSKIFREKRAAGSYFGKGIAIGTELQNNGTLEDRMELAVSYIFRGDVLEEMGAVADAINDQETAIILLEALLDDDMLDDPELLVSMHQGCAANLMAQKRMAEAEKHLIRVVEMGLPEMKGVIADIKNGAL